MIFLDTNVLSEVMKVSPSPRVVEWWNSHPEAELYLTSITQAEILATWNTGDFEHCGVALINPGA
jgi:predicted nucleic acid-binding protein